MQKPDSNLKLLLQDKQFDSNGPSHVAQVLSQVIGEHVLSPVSTY